MVIADVNDAKVMHERVKNVFKISGCSMKSYR